MVAPGGETGEAAPVLAHSLSDGSARTSLAAATPSSRKGKYKVIFNAPLLCGMAYPDRSGMASPSPRAEQKDRCKRGPKPQPDSAALRSSGSKKCSLPGWTRHPTWSPAGDLGSARTRCCTVTRACLADPLLQQDLRAELLDHLYLGVEAAAQQRATPSTSAICSAHPLITETFLPCQNAPSSLAAVSGDRER